MTSIYGVPCRPGRRPNTPAARDNYNSKKRLGSVDTVDTMASISSGSVFRAIQQRIVDWLIPNFNSKSSRQLRNFANRGSPARNTPEYIQSDSSSCYGETPILGLKNGHSVELLGCRVPPGTPSSELSISSDYETFYEDRQPTNVSTYRCGKNTRERRRSPEPIQSHRKLSESSETKLSFSSDYGSLSYEKRVKIPRYSGNFDRNSNQNKAIHQKRECLTYSEIHESNDSSSDIDSSCINSYPARPNTPVEAPAATVVHKSSTSGEKKPYLYLSYGILDVEKVVKEFLTDADGKPCWPNMKQLKIYQSSTKCGDLLDPEYLLSDKPQNERDPGKFALAAYLHHVAHASTANSIKQARNALQGEDILDLAKVFENREFNTKYWDRGQIKYFFCPFTFDYLDVTRYKDLVLKSRWSLERKCEIFAKHLAKKIWPRCYQLLTAERNSESGYLHISDIGFEVFTKAFLMGHGLSLTHPCFARINNKIRTHFGRICQKRRAKIFAAVKESKAFNIKFYYL